MKKNIYIPIDTIINFPFKCRELVSLHDTIELNVAVFEKGIIKNLTNQTIDLVLKKSDGTNIQRKITSINGNIAKITLDTQATACTGKVECELILTDSSGQETTNTFTYNVKNTLSTDVMIKSQDDIEALEDMRALIATYKEEIEAIGESTHAVEALNNIKDYIDNNLSGLSSENIKASKNITDLKNQNDSATSNISGLNNLNDTAEEKLQEFREFDTSNIVTTLRDHSSQLNENTQDLATVKTDYAKKTDINNLANNKAEKSDLLSINAELSAQKSRIDTFVSLKDGSTTGDAELLDGRVDSNGVTHANIGESIRSNQKDYYLFKEKLTNLKIEEKINRNLYYFGSVTEDGSVVLDSEYPDSASAGTRIVNKDKYTRKNILIKCTDENLKYRIVGYDKVGNFIKRYDYTSEDTLVADEIYDNYIIVIGKKDDSVIPPEEIVEVANKIELHVVVNIEDMNYNYDFDNSKCNFLSNDKIDRLPYYIGDVNEADGNADEATDNRIYTKDYYENYGTFLIKNKYKKYIKYKVVYFNSRKNVIGYETFRDENIVIKETLNNEDIEYFKIVIAKKDDSAITINEIAIIANSIELFKNTRYSNNTYQKYYNTVNFKIGGLRADNGEFVTNEKRAYSDFIEVKGQIIISSKSGYEFSLRYYDKDKKFITSDSSFVSEKTVRENDIFRYITIVVKKGDDNLNTVDLSNNINVEFRLKNKNLLDNLMSSDKKATVSAITNGNISISRSEPQYPTMCAVKESIVNGKETRTVGWLYRDNVEPFNFYYSSGRADELKKIFTWDKSKTYNGSATPIEYSFAITAEGDVIAVYRGERILANNGNRQNPIVYPHTDYTKPVSIDFGSDEPPTSFLQNSGNCSIENYFFMCEYTRVYHQHAYVWRVTAPYTSKSNWEKIKTFDVSGDWNIGFKHCHMIDKDPFSDLLYLSTGDDSSAAKIYYSSDNGTTWNIACENSEKYCRQLNFIFTDKYVYWATDSGKPDMHYFFRTVRNSVGAIDMSKVEDLFKFPNVSSSVATYHVCYINNNDNLGILCLDRHDNAGNNPIKLYYWDIKDNTMKVLGELGSSDNELLYFGFRCEAVNHYLSYTDDRIICGFSYFPNQFSIFNNTPITEYNNITGGIDSDDVNEYRVNNISLSVTQ